MPKTLQQQQDQRVELRQEEQRAELRQEDFQQMEQWNVPQNQLAETRDAFRQRILAVQTELDASLQAEMHRQHPELAVQRAAPVPEPPVQQQPVEEGFKERRERMKKRKAAAAACPVGNEDTYDMVHDLRQDMTARMNSRNEAVLERCRQARVDTRVMLVMCQGYQTNKKGRPATPEDERKKRLDEQMIDDYLSGDQQRRKPHLDAFVNELLTTPITMDMFAPERFKRDAAKLKLLGDKFVYLENLQRENPDYFEALPQVQKDMLRAQEPLQRAFVGLMAGRFDKLGVNYNLAEYHSLQTPIDMGEQMEEIYTPQFAAALEQFQADSDRAIENEISRQMTEAEQVLAPEYDMAKRTIEENSGPGQEYEKYAGIRFTNRAYFYQYDEIAKYRAMLASHPEAYATHKAIVDQIYTELAKAMDIGADYYFKGKVLSYATDGNPPPGAQGASPLSGRLRSIYFRRLEQHQEEESKVQHRIIGLADLLRHYLEGEKLSFLATVTLAQMGHVTEAAQKRSLEGSVVPGITQEQAEAHGFVSSQYTTTREEAQRMVEASRGFLYARELGAGLAELRPTLPETVEINGKAYPLRSDYNRMVKAIVSRIIDENGELREGAYDYASELGYAFSAMSLVDVTMEPQTKKEKLALHYKNAINQFIAPTATELNGGTVPEEFLARLEEIMNCTSVFREDMEGVCMHNALFPVEFLNEALVKFVERVEKTKIPLAERKTQIRTAMEAENRPEAEIQAKLEAVSYLYSDAAAAMEELRKIRDMDPDSPDVPLPNTCICTGKFYSGLRQTLVAPEAPLDALEYDYTRDFDARIQAHPQFFVTYMKNNIAGIEAENHPLHAQLAQVEDHLRGGAPNLTPEDIQFLKSNSNMDDYKFGKHIAANVGVMEGGKNLIVESYAPGSGQYTVSPFSIHSTVGVYQNGATGMNEYYSHDNPFVEGRNIQTVVKTMHEILRNELPGDPLYQPQNQQNAGNAAH